MKKWIGLLVIVMFELLSATPVTASSFGTTYGFSPRGMAMANAMTAHTDNWDAVYYNVAGLGRTRAQTEEGGTETKEGINQLSVNYLATFPSLDININRIDSDTGNPLPTKGADNLDFGSFVLGGPWTLTPSTPCPR